MALKQENPPTLESSVDRFLFRWHDFPFDYWWRKRHNVAFGSSAHREMSFIDMYVEYREDLMISRSLQNARNDDWTTEDYESVGLGEEKQVISLTQEQIKEDYENLDLDQFDEK